MYGDPIKRIDKAIEEGRSFVGRDEIAESQSNRFMHGAEPKLRKSLKQLAEVGQRLLDEPPSDERPGFPQAYLEVTDPKVAEHILMSEREQILTQLRLAQELSDHILGMLEPFDLSELG